MPLGHPFAEPEACGVTPGDRMMGFAAVRGDGQSGSIRSADHAVTADFAGVGVMTCTASRPTVETWDLMPLLRAVAQP